MDAFPDNVMDAIRSRVTVHMEKKKQEWMSRQRHHIFEGLVKTAEHQQTMYSFLLDPSHLQWHADLCIELVEKQQGLDVRLFVRSVNHHYPSTDKTVREINVDRWARIDKLEQLSDRYEVFCKIKIHTLFQKV